MPAVAAVEGAILWPRTPTADTSEIQCHRNDSRVSSAREFSSFHPVKEEPVDTHSKALRINLDPRWYGTFAEIGAGQEVVRWFFRVGGAAGTVAKSMSAYDMQVSDAIYGHADRGH